MTKIRVTEGNRDLFTAETEEECLVKLQSIREEKGLLHLRSLGVFQDGMPARTAREWVRRFDGSA